ncbi:hypothetical protein ACEWY4_009846 [Coilia grayii]|uniref:F-box domain-containing protein n=1 Tax=Coilia grayii TaxID=363190 RepID=A0ABD1K7K0_9TELE
MVPCINAHYGCPFTMCRSRLAKHLEVCPASVVSCTMEWNRWPVEDIHQAFYENLLKESYAEEPLDYSMALRDQAHLFESLKMKALFPELIEKVEEEEEEPPVMKELEGAVGGARGSEAGMAGAGGGATGDPACPDGASYIPCEGELTQEEREALARSSEVDLTNYNVWERMFSMELSGCKHTAKSLGADPKQSTEQTRRRDQGTSLETLEEEPETSTNDMSAPDSSTSNLAQTPYRIDEKFLVAASIFACQTSPQKKVVYENITRTEIKTVRPFVIPSSFKARSSRIRNPSHLKKISKSVDTSDLGVDLDDMPKWDEVQATLLCSLEKELRGHLIAESSCSDPLFINVGTQTYDFLSAPFHPKDSLADITVGRDLNFHVQIELESVTGKHNKCSSAFTFLCNQLFRRDEFASHFRNVHADIQCNVSGWLEQRCPLAYLGCTFVQRRLRPAGQRATISYNKDMSAFNLRPELPPTLYEGVKSERKRARNTDSLSSLPFEVLVHVAEFLDSYSLSQLALVSKYMRDVSATLLHEKGMVSLKWEKKIYSTGGSCWRARKMVWQFSNCFSSVDKWCFDTCPSISEHLRVCSYYEAESKRDPVPLTGIFDAEDGIDRKQSLVSMFMRKK